VSLRDAIEAECENGHELLAEVDPVSGAITSVGIIDEKFEVWSFTSTAFCPECGGEITIGAVDE
jgi:hypothetical protein